MDIKMFLCGHKTSYSRLRPDICEHKQKTGIYVDIEYQTIENPAIFGHKEQTGLHVYIKPHIQG